MSRATLRKILYWALACIGVCYPFYSWWSYTGLYRWCGDLELALQGKGPYMVRINLCLPLVCLASWGIAFWLGAQVTRWLPPAAADPGVPATSATAAAGLFERKLLRFLIVGCVVAILVPAAMIYRDKSSSVVDVVPLNLADGTAPRSSHVQLTGLAIPGLAVTYASHYRFTYYADDSSDWDTYIPVVPPQWHTGEPVVYFLHPLKSTYLQHEAPRSITQAGLLLRDGLPGPAEYLFKKHGLMVATPPFMLDPDMQAGEGLHIATMIVCAVYLVIALPIVMFMLVGIYRGAGS
jgi:hypothetical protein